MKQSNKNTHRKENKDGTVITGDVQKNYGKSISDASNEEIYTALLCITKEKMAGIKRNEGNKKLYYISAEFLIGNCYPTT